MKKVKRLIALLLLVVMLVHCFAVISFAEMAENEFETILSAAEEAVKEWHLVGEQEIVTDDLIGEVEEVVSLREENVKHFHLEDGSYVAAQYNYPVHYVDENGEYIAINNTEKVNMKNTDTVR